MEKKVMREKKDTCGKQMQKHWLSQTDSKVNIKKVVFYPLYFHWAIQNFIEFPSVFPKPEPRYIEKQIFDISIKQISPMRFVCNILFTYLMYGPLYI